MSLPSQMRSKRRKSEKTISDSEIKNSPLTDSLTEKVSRDKENQMYSEGCKIVVGLDEAGAGCLAGPVTVCACYIPPTVQIAGLNDSKKLSEKKRENLFQQLTSSPDVCYSVVHIDNQTIDEINILQSRFLGMYQALNNVRDETKMCSSLVGVLVDGNQTPPQIKKLVESQSVVCETVVGGDGKCVCIAAASIIAKVTRDHLMVEYDKTYPGYGLSQNKGYGSPGHMQAVKELGSCLIHRKTFRGAS